MNIRISRTVFIAAVMTAGVLLAQPPLYAGYGKKDGKGMQDMRGKWDKKIEAIHEQLGLTPEQKEQLKAHREKHRTEAKALREQVRAKKDEMRQELQKAEFDMNKVQQLHNELKVLKNRKEDHRLNGILEVRQILTPEQFGKFMGLKNEWKSKKGYRQEKAADPKGSN